MSLMPMQKNDVNYRVVDRDLKYYIFDWDNNILHMPTRIHLEEQGADGSWHERAVSTSEYSQIRKHADRLRPPEGDWEVAFREFRDIEVERENVFVRDTRQAVDKVVNGLSEPGPSFKAFQKVLCEGRLFAIVTARGHSPDVVRRGVEYFLEKVLSPNDRKAMLANLRGYLECYEPGHGIDLNDEDAVIDFYLSLNKYHAVTSPHFAGFLGVKAGETPRAEVGKQHAIRDFVLHVLRIAHERGISKPISFGFSDDDEANVKLVETFISEGLAKEFPEVRFVVFDTSDPKLEFGRKFVVHGQLSLGI